MPLPDTHNMAAVYQTAYSPSVGGTPIASYIRAPIRGTIRKFRVILGGAITTADGTLTAVNVTSGVTIGTATMTQSGSAAGSLFEGSPTTLTSSYVNEGDIISLTPSGASGASIPGHLSVSFRPW